MSHFNQRASRGIRIMLVRRIALTAFTFATGVALARLLTPGEFGLFAIASFIVGAFGLLSDFGLAPSLIQRRGEVTHDDLKTGFTVQLLLTTVAVVLLFLLSPNIAALYPKAPRQTVWLVRALCLDLYLTPWGAISSLQLERRLMFGRIAWIEVAEGLTYQSTAVVLAAAGFGVWSLIWAVAARGVLGVAARFAAAPWPVGLRLDWAVTRQLLRFGATFQAQLLVDSISGWITPVLVGIAIGPQAVGFLTWASSNGRKPLLLTESIVRVAFPHFARLQDDRAEVERVLSLYLTAMWLSTGLWFVVLAVAGKPIVHVVYTARWAPAVPALVLYALSLQAGATEWIVGVALNGIGLVGVATRITLLRTVIAIAAGILAVLHFGFIGVPIGLIAAQIVTLPMQFSVFGKGAMLRVTTPGHWVVWPVATALACGAIANRATAGHAALFQSLLSTSTVISSYGLAAWTACPRDIRRSVLTRLGAWAGRRRRPVTAEGW